MGDLLHRKKFKVLDDMLNDQFALIHFCVKTEGVQLPSHLLIQPLLTLKISRYFRKEMFLLKDKVIADLLFGTEYFTCEVPFDAIWGVSGPSGKQIIWEESIPTEYITDDFLAQTIQREDEAPPASAPNLASVRKPAVSKPKLVAQKKIEEPVETSSGEGASEESPTPKKTKTKPSFLKRVK